MPDENQCNRELHQIAETLCQGLEDVIKIQDPELKRQYVNEMVNNVRHMAESLAGLDHKKE